MMKKTWTYRRSGVASSLLFALIVSGCLPAPCVNPDDDGTAVTLTPFSGRFGYGLSSPTYNFTGSLTKEALTDPAWRLSGELTFPTSGYSVGAPDVLVAESYPEQVTVTITVTPPPPGNIVAQVITKIPVTADIQASNQADFKIRIVTQKKTSAGVKAPEKQSSEGPWQYLQRFFLAG